MNGYIELRLPCQNDFTKSFFLKLFVGFVNDFPPIFLGGDVSFRIQRRWFWLFGLFYKKTDYVLFLSSLIFFLLYSQTETKGLLPGIIICLVLIVYWFKPKKTIIIISLVPLMYIFLSSDISQRVQKTIDFFDVYTSENTNKSLKEIYRSDESTYTRIQLINYGLDTIKNYFLI